MKKWMTISAMAFLFVGCNSKKAGIPSQTAENTAVGGLSKPADAENFTLTLSRGSGYSVYAGDDTGDLTDIELAADNRLRR